MSLSDNLATAWAEKYMNLKAKIDTAEKYPAFYKPGAVREWKREADDALKNYYRWLTEV